MRLLLGSLLIALLTLAMALIVAGYFLGAQVVWRLVDVGARIGYDKGAL